MGTLDQDVKAPGLFSVGILLVAAGLFTAVVDAGFGFYTLAMTALGILAMVVTMILRIRATVRFFEAYWLTLLYLLLTAVVIWLPEAWLASLGLGDTREPWGLRSFVARVVLLLVLEGLAAAAFRRMRDPSSFLAERGAVAANVTMLVQLGVILLAVVNMVATSALTQRLGTLDATRAGEFSLTDRTRSLLDSLDDLPAPVHATYLQFGTTYQAYGDQKPLGDRGIDFLKQYGEYSPRVVVKVFNGLEDVKQAKDYLAKLGVEDLEFKREDTVVFTYRPPGAKKPRRKDVAVTQWEFMGRSPLGSPRFKGEQIYTSAIQRIVFSEQKVYLLEGHGEHERWGSSDDPGHSFTEAADLIEKLALDVDTLSLGEKGRVPEDASLLVIAGPKTPLLPEEAKEVERYLRKGGSLLLLLDPPARGEEPLRTGLEGYLQELGIVPRPDHVCVDYEQGGTSQTVFLEPTKMLTYVEYSDHPIVSVLKKRGYPCRIYNACPVFAEPPEDAKDLTVKELVYVRRQALGNRTYAAKLFPGRRWGRPDPRTDIVDKRLSIAVAAERKIPATGSGGGPEKKDGEEKESRAATRVVVFGNSGFATDRGLSPTLAGRPANPFYAAGNPSLLTNAVSWAVERESLISIEPKTLENEFVNPSPRDQRLAKTVGVLAIPFLVFYLAVGVAWQRRR